MKRMWYDKQVQRSRTHLRSHRTAPRVRYIHQRSEPRAHWVKLCAGTVVPARFLFNLGVLTISAKELHINDDIKAKEVRMLDEKGEQLGIMAIDSAKAYAYDRDLDLVMIAPQAKPPVCRAMDYGKYCYEQDKREKEAKKKQQTMEVKEVQLSCRIDTHDFDTKANRAKKFLSDGNKVKVCLRFKGREIAHQELGREMLGRFAEACSEFGSVDKKPTLEGRQLTMFIAPMKNQSK